MNSVNIAALLFNDCVFIVQRWTERPNSLQVWHLRTVVWQSDITWHDKCSDRDEICGMQICLLGCTDGIFNEPTWFHNLKALPARQPRKVHKIQLSQSCLKAVWTVGERLELALSRRRSPGKYQKRSAQRCASLTSQCGKLEIDESKLHWLDRRNKRRKAVGSISKLLEIDPWCLEWKLVAIFLKT